MLASASEDGTVRLCEMENGNEIKTWAAHGGGVQSVRFAQDGRIVTGGRDRLVKVWDGNGTAQGLRGSARRGGAGDLQSRRYAGDCRRLERPAAGVHRCGRQEPAGELSANPVGVAEKVDMALKDLVAKQAAKDQLGAVAATPQAAAVKAQADLTAAQKAVTDTAAAAKVAADNVPKAKAAADQAKVAIATAQGDLKVKQLLHRPWWRMLPR